MAVDEMHINKMRIATMSSNNTFPLFSPPHVSTHVSQPTYSPLYLCLFLHLIISLAAFMKQTKRVVAKGDAKAVVTSPTAETNGTVQNSTTNSMSPTGLIKTATDSLLLPVIMGEPNERGLQEQQTTSFTDRNEMKDINNSVDVVAQDQQSTNVSQLNESEENDPVEPQTTMFYDWIDSDDEFIKAVIEWAEQNGY